MFGGLKEAGSSCGLFAAELDPGVGEGAIIDGFAPAVCNGLVPVVCPVWSVGVGIGDGGCDISSYWKLIRALLGLGATSDVGLSDAEGVWILPFFQSVLAKVCSHSQSAS